MVTEEARLGAEGSRRWQPLTPGAPHPLVPRSCELPKTQLTSCYPKAQNNPETQTMLRISSFRRCGNSNGCGREPECRRGERTRAKE